MAIQVDEYSETRAEKESLIETSYLGNHSTIKGKKGQAYYHIQDRQWYFVYDGVEYRVLGKNLSCNKENGWIKCNYIGYNSHAGANGRARFDEEQDIWEYQPSGSKDLFRVKNDKSLEFLRS